MKIKIHNSFEVIKNNKSKIFYNTVLDGLNTKFINGDNYTNYIAFGSGLHNDLTGVTTLQNQIDVKQSEIYGKNFDITKGEIFLKKSIELKADEYNGIVIKELAFTANILGNNIINYASDAEGITKTAGENLTIIATIFITIDNKQNICGGDNALFNILFGLKKAQDCDIKGVFCDGEFYGQGVLINDYNNNQSFNAISQIADNKLQINATLPASCDYKQILLTIDAKAAFCFSAKSYNNTDVNENINIELNYGAKDIEIKGFSNINNIYYGGQAISYNIQKAPCCVNDNFKNRFEIIIQENDKFCSSPNGNYFALFSGDCLEVFDISGENLKKLVVKNVNFAYLDVCNIMLDNDGNMYVNIKTAPYMSVFYKNGNELLHCYNVENYDDNIIYTALCEYGGNKYMYYINYDGIQKIYSCCKAYIVNGNYNEMFIKSCNGDLRHFYDKNSEKEIIYNSNDDTFTVYPQGLILADNVKNLLKNCTKAEIYGKLIFIQTGNKVKILQTETGEEFKIYDSGVRKIFYDNGYIIKLYANNKLSGMVADRYSGKLYDFSVNKKILGEILSVKLFNKAIIITAKTRFKDCYFLPFNRDKILLYCDSLKNLSLSTVTIDVNRKTYLNQNGKDLIIKLNL